MLLDLEDVNIRARIALAPRDRVRLTLEYPHLPRYRDRVLNALADLLRPSPVVDDADAASGSDRDDRADLKG